MLSPVRCRPWILILVASLVPVGAAAQLATAGSKPVAARGWTTPRNGDGHPDLEGVWENNSATPLGRPAKFANKPRLSDEELAELKRRASRLFGPDSEAVFGDAFYLA